MEMKMKIWDMEDYVRYLNTEKQKFLNSEKPVFKLQGQYYLIASQSKLEIWQPAAKRISSLGWTLICVWFQMNQKLLA